MTIASWNFEARAGWLSSTSTSMSMSIRQEWARRRRYGVQRHGQGYLIACPSVASIGMARCVYGDQKAYRAFDWALAFHFTLAVSHLFDILLCIRLHGQIKHGPRDGHEVRVGREPLFSYHSTSTRYTEHKSEARKAWAWAWASVWSRMGQVVTTHHRTSLVPASPPNLYENFHKKKRSELKAALHLPLMAKYLSKANHGSHRQPHYDLLLGPFFSWWPIPKGPVFGCTPSDSFYVKQLLVSFLHPRPCISRTFRFIPTEAMARPLPQSWSALA